VPPNERNGRVQTSTITVAVVREPEPQEFVIHERDLEISACRGSGKGGQARNKTSSAIQIKHIPTGITAVSDGERSQHQNRALALAVLRARLWSVREASVHDALNALRQKQIGSGQRGDKRRTIAYQRGTVDDHVTGRRWRLDEYLSGRW